MSGPPTQGRKIVLFARSNDSEVTTVAEILRQETVGGALMLVAAAAALIWAGIDFESYEHLVHVQIGPMSLQHWTADGALTIFFFVAGLELKRELTEGSLSKPSQALVPIVAAACGMIIPALCYLAVNAAAPSGRLEGWAVPMATDIAFALAILAVVGRSLPTSMRAFLLTLAVVDDLLAITIIAVFYTSSLSVTPLLLALVPLALFGYLVQRRVRSWWMLLPLALLTWGLVHASGVHATVAGVLLAFTVPVRRSPAAGGPDAGPGLAEHFEHRFRPLSAGVAVPVFAFFAAGVTVGGLSGLADSLTDTVALGIVAGLVVGKAIGITTATWLVARFTRAELDADLGWWDVLGLALLGGIGFTVSLLIGELAFGPGSLRDEHAKVGVLVGTVTAALLAGVLLRLRNRRYRRIAVLEQADADQDGVPDVYQRPSAEG